MGACASTCAAGPRRLRHRRPGNNLQTEIANCAACAGACAVTPSAWRHRHLRRGRLRHRVHDGPRQLRRHGGQRLRGRRHRAPPPPTAARWWRGALRRAPPPPRPPPPPPPLLPPPPPPPLPPRGRPRSRLPRPGPLAPRRCPRRPRPRVRRRPGLRHRPLRPLPARPPPGAAARVACAAGLGGATHGACGTTRRCPTALHPRDRAARARASTPPPPCDGGTASGMRGPRCVAPASNAWPRGTPSRRCVMGRVPPSAPHQWVEAARAPPPFVGDCDEAWPPRGCDRRCSCRPRRHPRHLHGLPDGADPLRHHLHRPQRPRPRELRRCGRACAAGQSCIAGACGVYGDRQRLLRRPRGGHGDHDDQHGPLAGHRRDGRDQRRPLHADGLRGGAVHLPAPVAGGGRRRVGDRRGDGRRGLAPHGAERPRQRVQQRGDQPRAGRGDAPVHHRRGHRAAPSRPPRGTAAPAASSPSSRAAR